MTKRSFPSLATCLASLALAAVLLLAAMGFVYFNEDPLLIYGSGSAVCQLTDEGRAAGTDAILKAVGKGPWAVADPVAARDRLDQLRIWVAEIADPCARAMDVYGLEVYASELDARASRDRSVALRRKFRGAR